MRKVLLSMVFGFALVGCGSGDDPNDAFRPPPPPVASSITIASSAPSMPSDNSAPVTITVLARDANNVAVGEVPVTFSATSGALVVAGPATGANGEATATLTTGGDATLRTITVTATSGSLTASTLVQVVAPVASAQPPSVSASSVAGISFKANVRGLRATSVADGGSASGSGVTSQSNAGHFADSTAVLSNSLCVAESFEEIYGVADVPPASIANAGAGTVHILFADLSGNPLGAGTTISGAVEGEGISLVSPSTFTVPCTTEQTAYPFTITKTGAADAGALTITVTSLSGAQSVLSYPIITN